MSVIFIPMESGDGITALSGDVVATGPGAVTATIPNGAVTSAKLAATLSGKTLQSMQIANYLDFAEVSPTGNPPTGYRRLEARTDGLYVITSSGSATNITPQDAGTVLTNLTCDTTVFAGAAVRLDSGVIVNALADSLSNSNIIGIVESKTSSTICSVRLLGVTGALYSGLDETKEYFLSDVTPGEITTAVPTASGHVVLKVGQPFSSTKFVVLKGQRTVRA